VEDSTLQILMLQDHVVADNHLVEGYNCNLNPQIAAISSKTVV